MDSSLATNHPRPDGSATYLSMQRSVSNISSTSSDILVATNPASTTSRDDMRSQHFMDRRQNNADRQKGDQSPLHRTITARLQNRRILIVQLTPQRLADLLSSGSHDTLNRSRISSPSTPSIYPDDAVNTKGANGRGTYSKEYTLQHPEIAWIHRGQGRYLPSSQFKEESIVALQRPTRPIQLETVQQIDTITPSKQNPPPPPPPPVQEQEVKATLSRTNTQTSTTSISATPEVQRRKRRAVHETLQDSLSPVPVYGLRHRPSLLPTPLTPAERPAISQRPARRVKSLPGTFIASKSGRGLQTPGTAESLIALADQEAKAHDLFLTKNDQKESVTEDKREALGDSSEDAMTDSEDGQTYNRDYVNAHPNENFHHVGNGWWKRGRKGKRSRNSSRIRDTSDNVERLADGSYTLDPTKTVHGSQLEKFPGYEFHHTGNGWYKAGPMPSAKRTSIQIPVPSASPSNADDADTKDRLTKTVSKEHTQQHPEIEWMHRGNGRYIARDGRTQTSTPTTTSAPSPSERRLSRDDSTVDKPYVDSHPNETWHHTGNGRYRRGHRISLKINPGLLQSAKAHEDDGAHANGLSFNNDDENGDDEDANTLYDKAYVDAHPEIDFHHRGQGRYKRGPRQSKLDASTPTSSFIHDEADGVDLLVDTAYVEAHPGETFHHKGQGRWARGMPPPGSSNKTAVRGPGAKVRLENDKAPEPEDEEPTNEDGERPPALTALVLRSDGPDKWPNIQWHYRGGGKWSRLTKMQWEQKHAGGQDFSVATFSRYRPRRTLIGTTADPADTDGFDDEASVVGDAEHETSPVKRRRRLPRYPAAAVRDEGHQSSQSQSDAPTPRPQMLLPEDDVLGPEDLPDLFRDSFSPIDPDDDDAAGRLYRAQYRPLNVEALLRSLTKYEPSIRPMDNLLLLAQNTQEAMEALQDEYLELERITAPHSRIPRKPAKGGRLPAPPQVFEDRKEAELYDYNYDPRKVGYQDPIAQRIIRDAEGRELRKRRVRNALDPNATLPGWDFGDGPDLAQKRQSRQPTRFDGTAAPQSTRRRGNPMERTNTATSTASVAQRARLSTTPERTSTPFPQPSSQSGLSSLQASYQPAASGRWAGHVPKRIRELQRENSVGSVRSDVTNNSAGIGEVTSTLPANGSTSPSTAEKRKGRPPGSKNHHKRRDAGIKKGPRKPKTPAANADDDDDDEMLANDDGQIMRDATMDEAEIWDDGTYRSQTPEVAMGGM